MSTVDSDDTTVTQAPARLSSSDTQASASVPVDGTQASPSVPTDDTQFDIPPMTGGQCFNIKPPAPDPELYNGNWAFGFPIPYEWVSKQVVLFGGTKSRDQVISDADDGIREICAKIAEGHDTLPVKHMQLRNGRNALRKRT
ncbi:hypothetical protein EUX98_g9070 [Antrodiella citrinella]|uniref:Uncharacterized protein n=1 Tax=Antrodiella citrinella TaxID=2447956 RepID=A0A4S4M005_9APHY|nr:hypothetical protein EUX98_g9070 [Antrodiella citrinella]